MTYYKDSTCVICMGFYRYSSVIIFITDNIWANYKFAKCTAIHNK